MPRQYWAKYVPAVLVLLSMCLSLGIRVSARCVGNWGMLALVRVVLQDNMDQASIVQAARLVDLALALDPTRSHLLAAQRWLKGHQIRAAQALQHQTARAQIEASIPPRGSAASDERLLSDLVSQTDDVEAWLTLASIYKDQGNSVALEQVLGRLNAKAPSQSIGNVFTLGALRLEGYDWLPLSTGLFQRARIVLYWRAPMQSTTMLDPQAGIYQWGERLLQVIVAQNLIANGDMEHLRFAGLSPVPVPWRLAFHDARQGPTPAEIVPSECCSGGSILKVRNVYSETILYTLPPMKAGTNYLLVGQMRTSGNGMYMVMENVDGKNRYPLAIPSSGDTVWRSYAGVFSPVAAQYIGVYIAVRGDPSVTGEYDNLGLVEISLPPTR
jgi:hypothetical protein